MTRSSRSSGADLCELRPACPASDVPRTSTAPLRNRARGDVAEVQRVGEDRQPLNLLPAGDATPAEGLRVSGPIELPTLRRRRRLCRLRAQGAAAPAGAREVSANANAANHLYPVARLGACEPRRARRRIRVRRGRRPAAAAAAATP